MKSTVQPISLTGSRYAIGFQHGQALQTKIHDFLNDRTCRLEAIMLSPLAPAEIKQQGMAYSSFIQKFLPDIDEELHGLAAGANITYEQAVLLQVRRELAGHNHIQTNGDCTSFVVGTKSHSIVAQTIDLNGNMCKELSLLRINHHTKNHIPHLLLISFTGLIGYLGINSNGLAIGLNLVLGGNWEPGIPGYMLIRHLLDKASTVAEALEIIASLPLASSRNLILCDTNQKLMVEYIKNEHHLITDNVMVHANHFIHPSFETRDQLNPLAKVFSKQREQACKERLEKISNIPTPGECMQILNTPPIYVSPKEEIRREETVAMVIMQPALGKISLRIAENDFTQAFELNSVAEYEKQ